MSTKLIMESEGMDQYQTFSQSQQQVFDQVNNEYQQKRESSDEEFERQFKAMLQHQITSDIDPLITRDKQANETKVDSFPDVTAFPTDLTRIIMNYLY